MGEETIQFASRFAIAVGQLSDLATGGAGGALEGVRGEALAAAVRVALDAVQAVYETATTDVRNWPEQRRRVLAQVAAMREALDRAGVDGHVRRMASALVNAIEASPGSR